MVLERMARLVSQAEKEGVTLAEVIAREMSSEEMDLAQDALAAHMDDTYERIRDFMSDVSVPSLEQVLSRMPASADDEMLLMALLSDDEVAGD